MKLAVIDGSGYVDGETGIPFMSPLLVTNGEVDHYIERYKEELDRVGAKAKRALKRANKETLDSIGERRGSK
ncbi:MAG: hypothetical protein F4171_01090 [Gammaproteobacteria bacterium]|nr:hypothetical protein [Gammaproteobacteria bacterium]MYG11380.1 hypothetical protein [Gammaproteobacteria bacterium]MYK28897.1 hypothetical protein [Gammaproteobacteria bacterium]